MEATTVRARRTVQIGDLTIGGAPPSVIVPLTGADVPALLGQAQSVSSHPLAGRIDLVEWRVDLLRDRLRTPEKLVELASRVRTETGGKPLLATVRTQAEGGSAAMSDLDYLELITALSSCPAVDAVDVEHRRTTARRAVQAAQSAGATVVASHHDFQSTPSAQEILRQLRSMAQTGAEVLKIAVMPRTPQDVLTLLDTTLEASGRVDQPIITMSMGELGVATRLSGGLFGSAATFATLHEVSAPGQLPLETVITVMDAQGSHHKDHDAPH